MKFVTSLSLSLLMGLSLATAARAEGDAAAGEKVFVKCKVCHTIEKGAPSKIGPNLNGVFGRKAGSLDGFKYSDPLKNAGYQWTPEKVNEWLTKPQAFLPGNKMAFPGLPNEKDRADVIAYIQAASK